MKVPPRVQWIVDHPTESYDVGWPSPPSVPLIDRLRERMSPGTNGCTLWLGAHNAERYPTLMIRPKRMSVVRVLWYLEYGTWPTIARHTCDNKWCIALEHIVDGTQQDNMRDFMERGSHWQVAKTECPHGHPYTPDNTYLTRSGHRSCKECHHIRYKRRKE